MIYDQNVQSIIGKLQLLKHPEGGFYKRTYESDIQIQFDGQIRKSSSSIYYFLETNDQSSLHKLKSDEIIHFYAGDQLLVIQFDPYKGSFSQNVIGNNIIDGNLPQIIIKKDNWFGFRSIYSFKNGDQVINKDIFGYSLVGCTVTPGFDFQDFELAENQEQLGQKFDLLEADQKKILEELILKK